MSEEKFREWISSEFEKEAEELEKRLQEHEAADPELAALEMPEDSFDDLMRRIKAEEENKNISKNENGPAKKPFRIRKRTLLAVAAAAILVAAMCALIREYGGFDALLNWIRKIFRGQKGGQLGMGLLVGTIDIATANNTVAIVMANPIAKEMSHEYGITPRKTASILDTFSCIFQGIIPYGAQMLVAISAVNELGGEISAFQIMPKLFYPMFLFVVSIITIARSEK